MDVLGRWRAVIAPSLLALLLAASPAEAASKPADCVLAERDKPTLDARVLPSARFRMVTEPIGWERDAAGERIELTLRHGEEIAELRDGVQLRVRLGGCETYTNSYVFSPPVELPAGADGAYWLSRAGTLLREVAPASLDTMVPLPELASELAERAKDPAAGRDLASTGVDGALGGPTGPIGSRLRERQAEPS